MSMEYMQQYSMSFTLGAGLKPSASAMLAQYVAYPAAVGSSQTLVMNDVCLR